MSSIIIMKRAHEEKISIWEESGPGPLALSAVLSQMAYHFPNHLLPSLCRTVSCVLRLVHRRNVLKS